MTNKTVLSDQEWIQRGSEEQFFLYCDEDELDKNGWGNRFPDELTAIFNAADKMADRIRAIIPQPEKVVI